MSDIGGLGGGVGGGNIATAKVTLTGDASGVAGAVTQANNSLATLEKAVAQNWWGLRNLGLAFAALPAAVGAGAAFAVKGAAEIQDAMVGVARTADLMGESNKDALDGLQEQLFAIGKIRATPTLEILGIAESAGALGVATDDIAAFTQTVVDLVSTTDITAETGATGLARLAALTGTTSGGYDNLASSIMNTGVATAATESDILQMSQRLAGLGAALGLSADQIIGWAAAILSAGIRTNEGATQIQKTFIDIKRAVSENGKDLEAWAKIAGLSADEFKNSFNQDASQGLLQVVTGLGNIVARGGDFVAYLDAAGVKEQRQTRLLLQLAAAQANNANEHAKASYILQVAANGYQNLERYQSAVEARNKTFSASMQELQNVILQTGSALGNVLIGPLQTLIGIVQTLAVGLGVIDGPAKALIASIVGIVTVASALAAILLLVGPRILLAWDALNRIQASAGGAAGGLATVAGTQSELAGAAGRAGIAVADENNKLLQQVAAARVLGQNITILTGQEQQLAEAEVLAGQGAAIQAQETSTAASWLRVLGNVALVTTSIMVGLAAYTYAVGRAQQSLEADQRKAQASNDDLTASMRRSGSAINDNSVAVLNGLPAYQQAINSATKLGIAQGDVQSIVTGAGGATEWQRFLDTIDSSQIKGSDSANELIRNVYNLRQQFKNSAGDAGVATMAIQQQAGATEDLGGVTEDAAKALNKFRDAEITIAQAIVDLIDAELAQRAAEIALTDSEKELADAQEALANKSETLWELGVRYQASLLDQQKAARDFQQAQENLAQARVIAAQRVQDAEDKLASDRSDALDIADRIADKEQEISDLQENSAETARKLEQATNKLANARLKLRHATLEVTELEQNLAYLQQNGAGANDIAEAQLALADAKQNVADATEEVHTAEQDLADITDPVKRAKAIAKAERELDDLRRQESKNNRQLAQDEKDLADARQRQADDTDYKDAQDELAQAFLRLLDATKSAKDAQKALNAVQDGSLEADVAKKQLAYEQQLWATAKANVEVQKQTALANGETWDAGRAAHALADELGKLNIAQGEANDLRNKWIEALSKAPNIPPQAESSSGGGGVGGIGGGGAPDIPDLGQGDQGVLLPKSALPKAEADWKDFLVGLGATGGAFLVGQLGASLVKALGRVFFPKAATDAIVAGAKGAGAAAGEAGALSETEAMLASMGASAPEIAAAEEGAIVAAGAEVAGGSALATAGLVLAAAVVAAILVGLGAYFSDWFKDHWYVLLYGALTNPFITLPIAIGAYGKDIAIALYNGLKDHLGDIGKFFKELPGHIIEWLGQAKDWLADNWGKILVSILFPLGVVIIAARQFGPKVIGAIRDALAYALPGLIDFVKNIPKRLFEALLALAGVDFGDIGGKIVGGIKDGLVWAWDHTIGPWIGDIPGWFTSAFSNAGGWLLEVGKNIIAGLWDGITWMWSNTVGDFAGWIWDHTVGPLLSLLGIQSPSTVFFQIGVDILTGLLNGFLSMIQRIGKFFIDLAKGIVDFFKDAPRWLVDKGKDILEGLWHGIQDAFAAGWHFFGDLYSMVTGFFGDAISWLATAGGDIISGLWNGVRWVFGTGFGAISGIPGAIGSVFTGAINWLAQTGGDIIQGLWNGVIWVKDQIIDHFGDIPHWIWDKLSGLFGGPINWLVDTGKDLLNGLWNGISDAWNDIEGNITDLGGTIIRVAKQATGVKSPSWMMHEVGRMIGLGLANGIKAEQDSVAQAAGLLGKAAMVKVSAADLSALGLDGFGQDPFKGLGTQKAIWNAGNTTTIVNQNTLDLDLHDQKTGQEVINEWAWFNRVGTRSGG